MTNEQKKRQKELAEFFDSITRPNLDECFAGIKKYVDMCERDRKQALDLVESWNETDEIKRLRNEIESIHQTEREGIVFKIEPETKKKIYDWMDKHIEEKHNGNAYAGAIGGKFNYVFTPTSIGVVGVVKCSCGAEYCFQELG